MLPTIGRIVIFRQGTADAPRNGTREHPAIVTRAWTDTNVNLQVLFDSGPVATMTSVQHESVAAPGAFS